MLNPEVVKGLVGVSSFLGLLALLAYFYVLAQVRIAERSVRSVREVVEGDGSFIARQIVQILEQFKEDAARLQALRQLTNFDTKKLQSLLAGIEDKVDVARLAKLSTGRYLSAVCGILFGTLAVLGLIYSRTVQTEVTAPQPSTGSRPPSTTGEMVVDFSAGNKAPSPRYLVAAAPYLKDAGISIVALQPPESAVVIVNNLGLYGGGAVRPTTSENFLTQADTGNVPASFTLSFSEPLESMSFTRPKLYADTKSGVTHPAWSAHALDAHGQELSSTSEGLLRSFEAKEPATYTLRAPGFDGIVAVRFDSDPRMDGKPFAGFSTLLVERLTLIRTRK